MFKLSTEFTFPWPVKVIEPDPDKAGKLIEREFEAIFAFIDPGAAKASEVARAEILKKFKPDLKVKELRAIQDELDVHDRDALRGVLRGWSGIVGADDNPLAFSPENVDALYRHQRVRNGLLRAYQEAISEDKARLGN